MPCRVARSVADLSHQADLYEAFQIALEGVPCNVREESLALQEGRAVTTSASAKAQNNFAMVLPPATPTLGASEPALHLRALCARRGA